MTRVLATRQPGHGHQQPIGSHQHQPGEGRHGHRPDHPGEVEGVDQPGEAEHRTAQDSTRADRMATRDPDPTLPPAAPDPGGNDRLAVRLGAAMALLPPILGGAPTQPLEVGRTSQVVTVAQRRALAVRDGGCTFPDCDRPLAWCEAHHLRHWLEGGPTDLANLVLLCRAHHRAVHEGGWRLQRQPDRRLAATQPDRPSRSHRPHR